MKFSTLLQSIAIGCVVLFQSCSSDADDTIVRHEGMYQDGVFILNEGGMAASTSSVNFLTNNGVMYQDIYRAVNGSGSGLGSLLQSMFFSDEYGFIVSGLANQVTVVDRYTFEYVATIDTNLDMPRYGVVVGNKAYVTNLADYATGSDDFLTIIDLTNFTTTKVVLGDWSEKITTHNGKLYVMNGYYDQGQSISVVNTNGNTEKKIALTFSPNSIAQDANNLYVTGQGNVAKLSFSTQEIVGEVVQLGEALVAAKNLQIENETLYFTENNKVYSLTTSLEGFNDEPLLSYEAGSQWTAMYGFAVKNGKIYIAEGGDFASNSEIYIYTTSGQLLNTYSVGIAPNGFYFN